MIYCVIKSGVPKAPPRVIEYRSYKHYDKNLFLQDLKDIDWDPVFDAEDINEAVNTWCTLYSNAADQHAPMKTQRIKGLKTPWLTPHLTRLMRERDYYHKKAVKSKCPDQWSTYRKLRCKVNEEVKKAKSTHFQDCINLNKRNPSGLWKTLNEITSRDNKSGHIPTSIVYDEVTHIDPTSIANVFNEYFTSVGLKLAKEIVDKTRSFVLPSSDGAVSTSCFSFTTIEETFVYNFLRSLKTKKAIGLDKISARLLKDSADVITPCLTYLFNKSLSSSIFPSSWKKGKVVPIFKSGNRTDIGNYRPITILPTLSKIFEKAVHLQLYTYLQENNLLSSDQFGFRPNLSTDVALTQLTENILDKLDNGYVTGAVFLDLKKAFDTVDHKLLLNKLQSSGLDKNSLSWFESYLSGREQVVSINNSFSAPRPITIGVPQGSILGPLLFLIFVNDLPRCLNHCKIVLYADDTLIYFSGKLALDVETCLNKDLKSVVKWMNSNLLTLNCAKSKLLLFGSSQRLKSLNTISIQINEQPLERENSLKYLGVTLNEDLSWNDHIANLISKSNRRLGLLKRIKHLLPTHARLTLFNSLILPLFDFGDIVWGDKNNVSLMKALQVQQNKAAKIILNKPLFSSSSVALESLKWKSLSQRRHAHRCIFIFKCLNNLINFNFNLVLNNKIHSHNTRQSCLLHLPKARTNWGKHKVTYHAVADFNNLESDCFNSKSLTLFKKKIFN